MRSISSRSNFCSSDLAANFRRSSTRTRSNRRSSMANCCKRSSSFLRKATSSSALFCVPFLFRVYGGRALGCSSLACFFQSFALGLFFAFDGFFFQEFRLEELFFVEFVLEGEGLKHGRNRRRRHNWGSRKRARRQNADLLPSLRQARSK